MRIAIFGGSFDPVHQGHIALAKAALKEIKLDKIFFVPAKKSPLKNHDPLLKPARRLKMLKHALRREKKFKISVFELKSSHPSYAVRTLQYFHRRFPKSDLYLLMGSDALKDFKKWKNWRKILKLSALIVGMRKGTRVSKIKLSKGIKVKIIWLKSEMPPISSTEIRSSFPKNRK